MDTYTRRESEIVVVDEDVVDTPVIGIENIHGIKLEKPTMRLLGTTFVNLLGKYGNFEVDSNSDGLADGVYVNFGTPSLDTINKIVGSFSQKVTGDGSSVFILIGFANKSIIEDHKYFIQGSVKADSGYVFIYYEASGDHLKPLSPLAKSFSNDGNNTSWITSGFIAQADTTGNFSFFIAVKYPDATTQNGKQLWTDGLQLIDLTERGALDPVRQAKYGVANWEDLTEEQLEAEIPYFDSVMSVNVEDGTASELTIENRGVNIFDNVWKYGDIYYDSGVELSSPTRMISTNYIPVSPNTVYSFWSNESGSFTGRYYRKDKSYIGGDPQPGNAPGIFTTPEDCYFMRLRLLSPRDTTPDDILFTLVQGNTLPNNYINMRNDSITIPDTVELHGFGGYFNEWSGNQYTKRISMESKTTDGSGNLALSGYLSGTKAIIMNNDSGEVQILDVAASIATGWNSQECTVWYVLSSASTIEVKGSGGIYIYEGQNNVLSPDSKANLAMMLGVTTEGTEETRAFVRNFSVNSRVNNIRFKPHFSRNVKTIPTSREYSISFDDPILDGDWDFRQHQDKPFTIKEKRSNGTESVDIKYHGCLVSDLDTSEDDVMIHRVSLVAETKEVS